MTAPAAARPPKVPQSVLVVIHTPGLQVLLIERAVAPGFPTSTNIPVGNSTLDSHST